jgi:hypothetical protein
MSLRSIVLSCCALVFTVGLFVGCEKPNAGASKKPKAGPQVTAGAKKAK